MRADRLVAVLLLLQRRGRVTAAEVAAELEISERTARRDLDALGTAGLPIYSRPGRNGGWELLGGGRTDLSGLTADEARALFLVAGPSSASPEVRAALRKLVRALPEPFRPQAEAASSAVIVDGRDWGRSGPVRRTPVHLDLVQRAVVEAICLRLDYVARDRSRSTRVVHPLGLAAKAGTWYLVANTERGLRTFRVDRIAEVEPTGDPVVRPADFDLAEAWRMILDDVDRVRLPVHAEGLVDAEAAGLCRFIFGDRASIGPPAGDGRVAVTIRGHHVASLAAELASLGGFIEITSPDEVRDALRAVGEAIVARYPRGGADIDAVARSSGSHGCASGAQATSSSSSVE